MADDVLITKQQTLEAAIPEALRLCRNSPKSVLVHIAEDSLLREENARLKTSVGEIMQVRDQRENRLHEENARLRGALKPFAEMALQKNMKEYDEAPDECVMTAGSWGNQPLLTFRLGDLRAALAAIKETEND